MAGIWYFRVALAMVFLVIPGVCVFLYPGNEGRSPGGYSLKNLVWDYAVVPFENGWPALVAAYVLFLIWTVVLYRQEGAHADPAAPLARQRLEGRLFASLWFWPLVVCACFALWYWLSRVVLEAGSVGWAGFRGLVGGVFGLTVAGVLLVLAVFGLWRWLRPVMVVAPGEEQADQAG